MKKAKWKKQLDKAFNKKAEYLKNLRENYASTRISVAVPDIRIQCTACHKEKHILDFPNGALFARDEGKTNVTCNICRQGFALRKKQNKQKRVGQKEERRFTRKAGRLLATAT